MMINLLRKARLKLAVENKPKKYLRYAIGEIALVVIGILIALQANTWYELRKDHNNAKAYHIRLTGDIRTELDILNNRIIYYTKVRQHGEAVIKALTVHPDSLGKRFLIDIYQASQTWEYRTSNDTYRELIASGNIKFVPNPKIRERITKYYSETEGLKLYWSFQTDYRELVRRHLPVATQQKIQNSCEISTNLSLESGETQLVSDCDPNIPTDEIEKSTAFLFSSKSLDKNELLLAANRLVSDIYLKLVIFEIKRKSAISLLAQMDSLAM